MHIFRPSSLSQIWFDLTLYVDHFDPQDTLHKLYYMSEMIFVMGIAVFSLRGVVGSYIAGTGVTLVLRIWASYHCKRARKDCIVQVIIWFVSIVPFIISFIVSVIYGSGATCVTNPFTNTDSCGRAGFVHFELWGGGLVLSVGLQFIAQAFKRFHLPMNIEHMTERLGLFTILCMGEQVLTLLFSDVYAVKNSYLMAVLGGAMIFSIQILYYDVVSSRIIVIGVCRRSHSLLLYMLSQC